MLRIQQDARGSFGPFCISSIGLENMISLGAVSVTSMARAAYKTIDWEESTRKHKTAFVA